MDDSRSGDVLDLVGEVRTDGEGLRLRVWSPPAITGTGLPALGLDLVDGTLLAGVWTGLGAPDDGGERTTVEGVLLDDRFGPIDDLDDPAEVVGAVRETPDGVRVCVLP